MGDQVNASQYKMKYQGLKQRIDKAQSSFVNNPGGIDLNSASLHLQIRRDGNGVPLPLARQDWGRLNQIEGFIPTIIEIRPAGVLPILSEIQQKLRAS
jgi:hypothetical protein